MNNNKNYKIGQTDHIEGMIAECVRKLDQLAPHPDRLHLAPLFTSQACGNVITAAFNGPNRRALALEAYNRDLPLRRQLETQLEALNKALAALTAFSPLPALQIA